MTAPRTAAVLGLGLIGGSIARGLAAKGVRVLGFDADADTVKAARLAGVLAEVLDPSLRQLRDADWIVISTPVPSALQLLERVSEIALGATLITDTCSTKRSIVAAAERLGVGTGFVGSHPMAGSHTSGWNASRPDLFRGTTTYLCAVSEHSSNTGAKRAMKEAENLWTFLGAGTERITALMHDQKVAATSHLPHLLSTTLAITLDSLDIGIRELGGGGKDMVRIAAGDGELWKTILLDNADLIVEATDALLARLTQFRTALAEGDADSVQNHLYRGRGWACPRP